MKILHPFGSSGGGTVTSVGSGFGITGGPIVAAGTLSLDIVVTGTSGAPTLITAAGGVAFANPNAFKTTNFVAGNGGPINITANPQIAAGTVVGQELRIVGSHAVNTVLFEDGTGLYLNGAFVAGLNDVLNLFWNGSLWVEDSRNQ